jgi:hypothetical protein
LGRVPAHVPELPHPVEEGRNGRVGSARVESLELVQSLVDGGPGLLGDPRRCEPRAVVLRDEVEDVEDKRLVIGRLRLLAIHVHVLIK